MRATLILLLSTAALAACGSATAPDAANDGAVTPSAVSSAPDGPSSGGRGAGGGGGAGDGLVPALPNTGAEAPCLQAVRLASDVLPGPVTCRR